MLSLEQLKMRLAGRPLDVNVFSLSRLSTWRPDEPTAHLTFLVLDIIRVDPLAEDVFADLKLEERKQKVWCMWLLHETGKRALLHFLPHHVQDLWSCGKCVLTYHSIPNSRWEFSLVPG